MDIHVYLNGSLLKKTRATRERVVRSMREGMSASLLREWVIRTPRQPQAYLKMRFVSAQAVPPAESQHLANAPATESARPRY